MFDKRCEDIIKELVEESKRIRQENTQYLKDLSTGSWIYDHKEYLESIQQQSPNTEKDDEPPIENRELFI